MKNMYFYHSLSMEKIIRHFVALIDFVKIKWKIIIHPFPYHDRDAVPAGSRRDLGRIRKRSLN